MKLLTPVELQALANKGEVDIVDVREPSEWSTGHVPGARLVPLETLKADPNGNLPKDNVVFVCARGGRSATAAALAESIGKKSVASLDGGTAAWIASSLPLTTPSSSSQSTSNSASNSALAAAAAADTGASLDAVVGQNLKAQRTEKGWSLDDLAREAGVSRTTLGQIEMGKSVPSISVVWKIAQTLGVHFSVLLASAPSSSSVLQTSRATAKKLTSADQRFTSRALFPLDQSGAAEFYELWLAPHSKEEAEPHRPGTRENLIVTAGKLELKFGGQVVHLGAGDCINFAADVGHSYVNNSSEDCWMYLVMNYAR